MDRNALLDHYAAGTEAVRAAVAGATDAELDARPPDGGWTAREVVHHLADSEARSMLRLRLLLAVDDPVIEVYDQDAWVDRLPDDGPVDGPLAVVAAVRALSLATLQAALRAAGPAVWDRAGRHPEHDEPYSVARWLELYAEHPHDHAAQIVAAMAGTEG